MREMTLWDIAAYWSECKILTPQLRHFSLMFLDKGHKGHFGWTFA